MQVHFLRAVQRTTEKVCSSLCFEEKRTFIKLGSLITIEEDKETVKQIFAAMVGELPLQNLFEHVQYTLCPSKHQQLESCKGMDRMVDA